MPAVGPNRSSVAVSLGTAKGNRIRIAREIPSFAGTVELSGFPDIAQKYRQSAFQLFRMAASIATENQDSDAMLDVVTLVLLLDGSEDGEIYRWSRSLVDVWSPDSEYRKRADQFTSNLQQRRRGVDLDTDIETTERQVIENMLSGFGIDPTSKPWTDHIDLALKDSNPGRVLQGCEHTFVTLSYTPAPLRRVGLEMAGPKTIRCTLHKYQVTGPDLDSINTEFIAKYCNSCKDRSPRPMDWEYSDEWQHAENERWTNYMIEFG